MPGPKESRAKPSRDNCKSCSSAGTPSCTNTAEGAGAAEKGTWIRRQTSCCHNSKGAACKACEGTRPPSAPTGPLLGGACGFCTKKSPLQRLRSDLGQGYTQMVVLSCLNVQNRLWKVEWRQSGEEATPQQTQDKERCHS